MTHFYSFGGLRIRSAIELPSLVLADPADTGWAGELDLRVEVGAPVGHAGVSCEWRNG